MPRIQPFLGFLRPAATPRIAVYRPALHFSTACRLHADEPVKPVEPTTIPSSTTASVPKAPSPSSSAPPPTPSSPQAASRSADLAAVEAAIEADSAQPPVPKPSLPSTHTKSTEPQASPSKPADGDSSTPTPRTKPQSPKPTQKPKPQPAPPKIQILPPGKAKTLKLAAKAAKAEKDQQQRTGVPTGKSQNSSAPGPSERTGLELPPPRYHVARVNGRNYPIYTDYKRGGNLHLTTVRKVTGDLLALRDELRVFLNKKGEDVKVNSLTRHVIIKGHHVPEVTKFLQARGM